MAQCLYINDNAIKLATTSTGVDVTGIAVTDGLNSRHWHCLDVLHISSNQTPLSLSSTGNTQRFLQETDASSNDQFWGLQVSAVLLISFATMTE